MNKNQQKKIALYAVVLLIVYILFFKNKCTGNIIPSIETYVSSNVDSTNCLQAPPDLKTAKCYNTFGREVGHEKTSNDCCDPDGINGGNKWK